MKAAFEVHFIFCVFMIVFIPKYSSQHIRKDSQTSDPKPTVTSHAVNKENDSFYEAIVDEKRDIGPELSTHSPKSTNLDTVAIDSNNIGINLPELKKIELDKDKTNSVNVNDNSGKSSFETTENLRSGPLTNDPVEQIVREHYGHTEGRILIVSLGGGEDEIFASQAAWLFTQDGHDVTVLLYGSEREELFPKKAKIIEIPIDREDPLRPEGFLMGLTPDDKSEGELTPKKIIESRLRACIHLKDVQSQIMSLKVKLIVSPLFLHDACILPLAEKIDVPVVGILTSRVGARWTLAHLGVLSHFSTVAVPLKIMSDTSFWSRTSNLVDHYFYMSNIHQQWQANAISSLPDFLTPVRPLPELYDKVIRLIYTWDSMVDPQIGHFHVAISVGGFASTFVGDMKKDILVPTILNRAGIVVASIGTGEVWIGGANVQLLYESLKATSFTILWKVRHKFLKPNTKANITTAASHAAKFIFKENIPLNDVLSHSRHRFFISTCGEHDVMAAVHYGSSLLCLPVTSDQILAAQELHKLGMAEMILASQLNKENLRLALAKLTSQRSYRLKARDLAEELHDQSTTPSERFIYHVENVMRRPTSRRYKVYGNTLSHFELSNTDIYLGFILITCFVCILMAIGIIKLYPIALRTFKQKDD